MREYYLNDSGGQVRLFAESIAARMRGDEPPENGYEGEYVAELARELGTRGVGPDDLDALEVEGVTPMREAIAATLERFEVRFDAWSSERALYEAGAVDAVLSELRERGHVYESEGATWLRTTDLGDDKDRVLLRSDGEPTYLAGDIAYHRDKLKRGADRLIDVLGASTSECCSTPTANRCAAASAPAPPSSRPTSPRPRRLWGTSSTSPTTS